MKGGNYRKCKKRTATKNQEMKDKESFYYFTFMKKERKKKKRKETKDKRKVYEWVAVKEKPENIL